VIINIRDKIKDYDQKTLDLLDKDLDKKPIITVDNIMGIYCGESYTATQVEEAIIEFNLRLVRNESQLRLPKGSEIDTKGKLFWLEEHPYSNEIKGLFLVMNIK
jgi:hypothetical protein